MTLTGHDGIVLALCTHGYVMYVCMCVCMYGYVFVCMYVCMSMGIMMGMYVCNGCV